MGLYQKKQLPTGSGGGRDRIKWKKEICPFFRILQDVPIELSSYKHVILQEKGRMTPKVVQSLAEIPCPLAQWAQPEDGTPLFGSKGVRAII